MFFSDLAQIPRLAARTGAATIALPPHRIADFSLQNALVITPDDEKSTPVITIDQIRAALTHLSTHQTSDQFLLIKHAELMNAPAASALLKNLEEPGDHYHFLLLTPDPALLLPTIRSRTQIYHYHNPADLPTPDPAILDLAKQLITTTGPALVPLADDLAKKPAKKSKTASAKKSPAKTAAAKSQNRVARAKSTKTASSPSIPEPPDSPRARALAATAAAIHLLEKSYLKTRNPKLLRRLRQLLSLHAALEANGHIKLQILAHLT